MVNLIQWYLWRLVRQSGSLINQIVLLDYWKYFPVIVLLEFIFALIILKADEITLNTVDPAIKETKLSGSTFQKICTKKCLSITIFSKIGIFYFTKAKQRLFQ